MSFSLQFMIKNRLSMIRLLAVLVFSGVTTHSIENKNIVKYAEDTLAQTHGQIIHASVVFRHGNRTPTNLFPTCEHAESTWWEGLGQLNKRGKHLMYDVGKWFRERYKALGITDGYNKDLLIMNSSDVDRTIMSAEVFLAALLSPNKNEIWSKDGLQWQPIPVHTKPTKIDEFIAGSPKCDRYDLEYNLASQSSNWQNFYRENEQLIRYIAENAGIQVSQYNILDLLKEVAHIYDAIKIMGYYNRSLPLWAAPIYPNPMSSLFPMYVYSRVSSKEMQRLQAGPLLGNMVHDMQKKRNGLTKQTFHFYSAHDTTLGALLVTLGLFDFVIPHYGTAFILELRKKNLQSYITIHYRNETNVPPYKLILSGCGEYCTLDKFVEITRPMIPADWLQECQVGWIECIFFHTSNTISVVLVAIAFFIVSVAVVIVASSWIRKKTRRAEYKAL